MRKLSFVILLTASVAGSASAQNATTSPQQVPDAPGHPASEPAAELVDQVSGSAGIPGLMATDLVSTLSGLGFEKYEINVGVGMRNTHVGAAVKFSDGVRVEALRGATIRDGALPPWLASLFDQIGITKKQADQARNFVKARLILAGEGTASKPFGSLIVTVRSDPAKPISFQEVVVQTKKQQSEEKIRLEAEQKEKRLAVAKALHIEFLRAGLEVRGVQAEGKQLTIFSSLCGNNVFLNNLASLLNDGKYAAPVRDAKFTSSDCYDPNERRSHTMGVDLIVRRIST